MALIYRSIFRTAKEDAEDQLESAFRDWLRHKRLDAELPASGARSLAGGQEVYRAQVAAEGLQALRLALFEPSTAESWRTTVTAVRTLDTSWNVVVDLERIGEGPSPAPMAPRLMSDLLGPSTASPAGTPLRPNAVEVGLDDVDTVLQFLRWPERDVPVVIAYDTAEAVPRLAAALAGVALVLHLEPPVAGRFNELVGAGYRIRRGAWRTYQPGLASESDDPRRHRAIAPERVASNAQGAVRIVAGSFRSAALAKRLPQLHRERLADLPGFRSAERITVREAPPLATDLEGRLAVAAQAEVDLVALVEETERNLADERSARADLEQERDDALLDSAMLADDLSAARARIQFLERQLLKVDIRPWELEPPVAVPVPGSFEELLESTAEHLSLLVLGPATRACLELNEHARSATWVVKAWDALLMLQSFAEARVAGDFEGNVEQWCRDCPPGARVVSSNALAMTEHETVQKSKPMREARTFDVPEAVHPDGRVVMYAHYKIDNKDPAPRLHFLDDTRGTGKVYVGYLGRHLLSPKTT
jgi:hypothetical protein